jgi:hypothetical protein
VDYSVTIRVKIETFLTNGRRGEDERPEGRIEGETHVIGTRWLAAVLAFLIAEAHGEGRNPFEHWSTDTGLLSPRRRHHVSWIIDGGPNLILPVVDGALGEGGEAASGWGRFSRCLTGVTDDGSTLSIAPQLEGRIEHLRIYRRPLRVTEAIGIHRHDKSGSRAPNGTP